MKIVVIGGHGLIGSRLVAILGEHGHEAVAAGPRSGVNTVTGEGLAEALDGADVVVDVCNSPSFADDDVMDFFRTGTENLVAAAQAAGVRHHVALSVVGCDRLPDSGYMRAKVAEEELVEGSSLPYTIVRATQFYEFVKVIADASAVGDTVRVPAALVQPIAAEDVSREVARAAEGEPAGGIVEIAGPEACSFEDLIRQELRARNDPRHVAVDPDAGYFGAKLADDSLLPVDAARLGETRFEDWLGRHAVAG
jgi:uncharacterized protein YbjT (DUF2867 family)